MDYYKNVDKICCPDSFGRIGQRRPAVEGIDYTVLADLAQEPVTLDEFKEHARIDHNVDDNLIAYYLKSAREYLERESQLSFGVKTIRFTALRVYDRYKLMHGPYTAINDPDRTLFGANGDILMQGGTEVDVELTSGWPNDILPDNFKVAIMRVAASYYMNRESNQYDANGRLMPNQDVADEAFAMIRNKANLTWP